MEKIIKEKHPYKKNLIIALVLGTLLFVGVFLFGYAYSNYNSQKLSQSQEELRYNLLSFEVEKELIEGDCEGFNPYFFTGEMDHMGSVIGILEERLGKRDARVLEQKEVYSLLQARHFLYIKEHNEDCNENVSNILFFYSNRKDYKDDAEKLGVMLSSLKNQEEVMIYSFDYDLEGNLLKILKEKYNVSRPNILVINGKTFLNKFENVEDIRKHL